MGWVLGFARAAAQGVVAYATPRLLIAIGVPLDKWIIAVSEWLQPAVGVASTSDAIFISTLLFLLALSIVELRWEPAGRLIRMVTRPQQSASGDQSKEAQSSTSAPEGPDFQKWDAKRVIHLYEAACLRVNQEPRMPLSPGLKRSLCVGEVVADWALPGISTFPGQHEAVATGPDCILGIEPRDFHGRR
jgi:hypothetical protein